MDSEQQHIVDRVLDDGKHVAGAMLPILHAIQDQIGYVPAEALPAIGKALNISRAEVHGVVTFYPHFRNKAPGRHVVQICRAEACQAMGANELLAHAQMTLRIGLHDTSADGEITLEPVYCLGNCACSPAIMVDDDLYGRVTPLRFNAIIAGLAAS